MPTVRFLTLYIAATFCCVRTAKDGFRHSSSKAMIKPTPDPPSDLEETLVRVSDLMRCASATAHEASDQLNGQGRDLTLTVIYLLDIAQAVIEPSIASVGGCPLPRQEMQNR
ncbi:DUF6124 family protein [Pseudomonas syringae group genomosp. 3]|uniref:DUF6124 family protein n=2 Tax=Pseudomonas syringae group genomosp. 3 TaxID=251701 RepID=UPI0039C8FCEF